MTSSYVDSSGNAASYQHLTDTADFRQWAAEDALAEKEELIDRDPITRPPGSEPIGDGIVDGPPLPPGWVAEAEAVYKYGDFEFKMSWDGKILVEEDDWLSKYSAALHDGDTTKTQQFKRIVGEGQDIRLVDIDDPNLIHEGEVLVYQPMVEISTSAIDKAIAEQERGLERIDSELATWLEIEDGMISETEEILGWGDDPASARYPKEILEASGVLERAKNSPGLGRVGWAFLAIPVAGLAVLGASWGMAVDTFKSMYGSYVNPTVSVVRGIHWVMSGKPTQEDLLNIRKGAISRLVTLYQARGHVQSGQSTFNYAELLDAIVGQQWSRRE